jgi:predicted helicase
VLRTIEERLRSKGEDALIGDDVKDAARERVFGFEIMSAPFVIAHWQVGNLLASLRAPLDASKGERPAIYLTNSLTGWEPPTGPKATLPLFPELEQERDQAEHVKRDVPILVVLGNPPYNAFAGTSPRNGQGLVEPYKEGLVRTWGIKKFNLDELYARFFRIAERRIRKTGRGIVSYISNYSYISEPSFVVMRQSLLKSFDKFWIENLHGDRNKSEYSTDGRTSETVFAIRGFSPGIRQGIVVTLAVRTGYPTTTKIVRFRDDLNAAKAHERRQELLDSLAHNEFDNQYEIANPQRFNKFSFRPGDVSGKYLAWPKLPELAEIQPINGLMEKRGGALIDIEPPALASRMAAYYDKNLDWAAYKLIHTALTMDSADFNAKKAREKAQKAEEFNPKHVVRYFVSSLLKNPEI